MNSWITAKALPLLRAMAIVALLNPHAHAGPELSDDVPMSSQWGTPHTSDLPDMIKRTEIVVGTTYSRTNFFFLPDGTNRGFEYSLLKDYETFLNKGRKSKSLPITVAFVPMPHDRLIPALRKGYCDIVAAGLTITPERLKKVDFTDPYLTGVDEVLVTHKNVIGIDSLTDLSDKKVYVRKSSSYYESLLDVNARFRAMKLRPIKIVEADETLATESILEMVNGGMVNASLADSHLANLWANVLPNIRVNDRVKIRQDGKLAWMVRKNNPELKASLNQFIRDHKRGTLKGNIYYQRYFEDTRWVKNPLGEAARKRFARYEGWFKKYGKKYGIDWLLIGSQAFHESGLDQSARSPAGAVGLMQVLPDLAEDKRIAIKDIYMPENNIHAGVKYLALLRDNYFSDPVITPDDRIRFALAAYNVGPSRIQRIRKRAETMGFDPNRWFRQSEVAALKVVGREPVRYVRDINIYYVALKLSRPYQKSNPLK